MKSDANPYVDIIVPIGIGIARNAVVVRIANIIVAIAGFSGTLSEMAFSWQKNKPVICVTKFGGWAAELVETKIDIKERALFIKRNKVDEIIEQVLKYSR